MSDAQDRPRRGFVYVHKGTAGPVASAEAGQLVRNPGRGPPWIVVDHELSSVVVAGWPGRLWEVEIVDAIANQESGSSIRDDAGYTRAAAVRVLRSVPVATLFGEHGTPVCTVIDAATRLDPEQARMLCDARHPEAREAYSRVWRRWFVSENIPLHRLSNEPEGTLAIARDTAKYGSPVGRALLIISSVVDERARTVSGKGVLGTDPANAEELCLAEPWASAKLALLDAALAFGAPDLSPSADRQILTAAWRHAVGPVAS
jgi:hypothetical protein